MYKPVDKIEISGKESLSIIDVIDIISINALIEEDRDIVCFSYVPKDGLTENEGKSIQILSEEGFKIDFVLTINKEIFYVIRKVCDNV